MVKLKSYPKGCKCPWLRGERTCVECYYSQVNENNQWTGSKRCWDAECIGIELVAVNK